jgi:hypothetical protein
MIFSGFVDWFKTLRIVKSILLSLDGIEVNVTIIGAVFIPLVCSSAKGTFLSWNAVFREGMYSLSFKTVSLLLDAIATFNSMYCLYLGAYYKSVL